MHPYAVTTWRSLRIKLEDARAKATNGKLSHAAKICCSSSLVVCVFWYYTWWYKINQVPNRKDTRSQIWRIVRWIHVASGMLWIIQGKNTIIAMFLERIDAISFSKLAGTVMHNPRLLSESSKTFFCRYKFTQSVQREQAVIVWRLKNLPNKSFEDIATKIITFGGRSDDGMATCWLSLDLIRQS